MRKLFALALSGVFICIMAGCASMSEESQKGAVTGGLLGAAGGAVIGHQSGETGEGAALGAAAGALAGGLIGESMAKERRNNPNHIIMEKIVDYSQRGLPDDVIIDRINRTNSVYYLSAEAISYLKDNGVSTAVIDHMLSTSRK